MFSSHLSWGRSGKHASEITSPINAAAGIAAVTDGLWHPSGAEASHDCALLLARSFQRVWQGCMVHSQSHVQHCVGQVMLLILDFCLWPKGAQDGCGL